MGNTQDNVVHGKSLITLPCFIRSRILRAIAIAEEKKGSPPNTPEVFVTMTQEFFELSSGWMHAFLGNLYREDLFYADDLFTFWSLDLEGPTDKKTYEKFSVRF